MRTMFLTLVCGGFLGLVLGCGGGSNKVEIPTNPTPPPQNPQLSKPPGAAPAPSSIPAPPPPPKRR